MIEESPQEFTDQSDEKFVLDKDQIESILLEAQQISPAEKTKLDELIVTANHKIAIEFSAITSPIPDSEMTKKFVFIDKDTMNELENAWAPHSDTNRSYANKEDVSGRAFLHDGQFVIELPFSTEFWGNLTDENKDTLIEDNGTEQNAKYMVQNALNLNVILHEGTHLYQLPIETNTELYLLRETQANWAEKQFTNEAERVSRLDSDKKGSFYQNLIDKYGKPNVHEYALTGNIQDDPWITFDIDSEFTGEVVKDLFPNLKNA